MAVRYFLLVPRFDPARDSTGCNIEKGCYQPAVPPLSPVPFFPTTAVHSAVENSTPCIIPLRRNVCRTALSPRSLLNSDSIGKYGTLFGYDLITGGNGRIPLLFSFESCDTAHSAVGRGLSPSSRVRSRRGCRCPTGTHFIGSPSRD